MIVDVCIEYKYSDLAHDFDFIKQTSESLIH